MSYESLIGWRYLYKGRGKHHRAFIWLFLTFAGTTILCGLLFYLTKQPPPMAVVGFTAGAVGLIVMALFFLFSVFTTVSVFGVVLGVAALIVVFSVTSGFQREFQDKVLGVNAHVLIMKNTHDFYEYEDVEDTARTLPHVMAVQPFIFEEMVITDTKGKVSGIALKGVDPARVGDVLDLPGHMIEGSVEALADLEADPPPIILGKELAAKLDVGMGDSVSIVSPLAGMNTKTWEATGKPPKTKKFTVAGIFYSGFDEYDRRLCYLNIKAAQDFLEQGNVVRGVEMKLDDVDQATKVARLLEKRLGGDPYMVMDWRELNNNLFTALVLQKVALVMFIMIIMVVAAFNIVASLTMMVFDKTKEIAILKSMGSSDGGVARIFQVCGLTIGGVGCSLGLGLGLLLCGVISRFGYPLDPRVYLIDHLPIEVSYVEMAIVAVVTVGICFLATLYPALKAARLRPVEGLRYE